MLFKYNRIYKTNAALFLSLVLLISLTSCGGTDSGSQTQTTAAVQSLEEDSAVETAASAESAKEEVPPSPASYVFDDPDALYINDGTISGLYYFYRPEQGTLQEFAEFSDMTPPQAARVMTVGITDDGKALYTDSEKSIECDFAIDGENITLSSENEEIYGTLKDGLLTLNLKGIDIDPVFARPTEVAEYVSGTWTGQYIKGTNDNGNVWKEVSQFSLQLYSDGSGILREEKSDERVTWEIQDGKIRLKSDLSGIPMFYIGTVSDHTISIFFDPKPDDPGMEYVFVREGAAGAKPNTEGTTAPGGDGIVSEEQLQKAYGWLHKVKRDLSHTTYEELVEFIGAEGELDNEETGRRFYQWVSEGNRSHILYVSFKENTSGVYTVNGYNTSGFDRADALSAYKEVHQEEIAAAEEAVANAATKDFSADIYPYGSDKNKVTVRAQIPEFGWGYDESTNRLVDNEDVSDISYDAGIIQFQTKSDISGFDIFLNAYTNLQTIDDRVIGGIRFKGRTYESVGTKKTEYIAALDADHAVSITIIHLDLSEGAVASRILDSMMFE